MPDDRDLEVIHSPEVASSAVKILQDALERAQSGEVREVVVFMVCRDQNLVSYTDIVSRYEIAGRLMAMANEMLQDE